MNKDRVRPAGCRTMVQVRQGIDRLDIEIVNLLAERFRYMEAAARIKASREAVRDEARKAEVLTKVRHAAQEAGAPAERIVELYERLIEASIAYEFERFDERGA